MGIIVVLVTFIVIDLSFYHGGEDVEAESEAITAAAVKSDDKANETENKTVEKPAEEKKVVVEEKKLSGRIGFVIDKITERLPLKNQTAQLYDLHFIFPTFTNNIVKRVNKAYSGTIADTVKDIFKTYLNTDESETAIKINVWSVQLGDIYWVHKCNHKGAVLLGTDFSFFLF